MREGGRKEEEGGMRGRERTMRMGERRMRKGEEKRITDRRDALKASVKVSFHPSCASPLLAILATLLPVAFHTNVGRQDELLCIQYAN